MDRNSFFLKGDICWSSSPNSLETAEDSFLLCLDGKSGGVFKDIPEQYAQLPVRDNTGLLVMPGLTDLHTHAPQFAFRGLGMDMELLEWLDKNTFPEEAKYKDIEYARQAYGRFVEDVKKGPNTRLCVFATVHIPASLLLADMLEESGLVSLVGKVSMDRNCPDFISETDAAGNSLAAGAVREWLEAFFKRQKEGLYKNTAPILTPRFVPSCTDELMRSLAEIQREFRDELNLPLQSHLSENKKEVEWVAELNPGSESYTGTYADFGHLEGPAIMAHCVWPDDREIELLAKKGVYIAHCPQSNINLSSGIAPVRRLMEKGVPLGLGSDVAGGAHTSIFRAMGDAIQVSKLRRFLAAEEKAISQEKALSLEEAFYLGTAGGGSFFAKLGNAGFGPAGSFEEGWDFDALIIDDSSFGGRRNLKDRLERIVYLSDDRHIVGKYVRGRTVV
ncbi:MAG: amidohydrolase family protein [Treponema sp.]|nr:amidohydrolase family protein [Treponema sp.]